MIGMSNTTGYAIETDDHIRQSIRDILTTPVGTRVMRREYGSMLPYLVDSPMDAVMQVEIIQATAAAINRWEPRVKVSKVEVESASPGLIAINLDVVLAESGRALRMEGLTL